MLVFSTRLPIKDSMTKDDCLRLLIEWITESPHYSINEIDYDVTSERDFDIVEGNVSFSIRHVKNEEVTLAVCRFENREPDAVWYNDSIYLDEKGEKSLFVQLNCNRTNYNAQLPKINKPYVVRKFVEGGFCKDDAGIPVCDTPIEVDDDLYSVCVEVMNGRYSNTMPVVYISCNQLGKYYVNPEDLAKKLGGVAHVFVERDRETALKLREDTDRNNAYMGYVGIYFPKTKLCRKHGAEYYTNEKEMRNDIINSVRSALTNKVDSSMYNWHQIIAMQNRQKLSEMQDISAKSKQQLSEYMDNFDAENEELRNQNAELNRQLYSAQAQLDIYRATMKDTDADSCFYKMGSEPNLYASERNDLLYSILSQALNKYEENSRGRVLIKSLLEANPYDGECSRIMGEIKNVFGGDGKLNSTKKTQLKTLGFTIEEDGSHYKLVFHDSRYTFSVSKTPSDHREGKNMISDITKMIDVTRKI